MTKVDEAAALLVEAAKQELGANVVLLTLTLNSQGYSVETQTRTPAELSASGISMRNIRGEFIK